MAALFREDCVTEVELGEAVEEVILGDELVEEIVSIVRDLKALSKLFSSGRSEIVQ